MSLPEDLSQRDRRLAKGQLTGARDLCTFESTKCGRLKESRSVTWFKKAAQLAAYWPMGQCWAIQRLSSFLYVAPFQAN